ncbi:hypothetical protein ACOSP7_013145 [Xanthoceras sorbifolium]
MLSNFRSTFKNLNMNGKLWNATKVGNAAGFHEVMESIKEDSVDAYVWLKAEPVNKWARHCFDPRIKSDHVANNMSECFNSWIKDKRDKPILTLLEHLRRKIMVRLCEKVDLVEKMVDSITPYARNKLVDNEKYARKLQVIHGRGAWYEMTLQHPISCHSIKPPTLPTTRQFALTNKVRRLATSIQFLQVRSLAFKPQGECELSHNVRQLVRRTRQIGINRRAWQGQRERYHLPSPLMATLHWWRCQESLTSPV